MIIKITIECDYISEINAHLQEMQKQVKTYANGNGLGVDDELSEGVVFEDSNCYGTHHFEVVSDEAENPFYLSGKELDEAVNQAKQY